MVESIDQLAISVSRQLQKLKHTLVLAESCTAGLIAASLSRISGASGWLAGSAVVYQLQTKESWLSMDPQMLVDSGAVSREVSEAMADRVLQQTPQATIAASVTGHLGPVAPARLDGIAWTTIAVRTDEGTSVQSRKLILDQEIGEDRPFAWSTSRDRRQRVAVRLVLQFCLDVLEREAPE